MGSGGSKPANANGNAPKTVLNTVSNASKSALNSITGASKTATSNSITVGSNSIPIAPAYNNKAVRNNAPRNNTRNNARNNTPRNNTVPKNTPRNNTRNNTRNTRNTRTAPMSPPEYIQVPVNRANNQVHGPQGLTGGRRKARKSANRKSPGGSRRRR